jgi:Ca2+-transporting ATPase
VVLYATSEADPDSMLRARALAFSLLALSPLMHALSCRSPIRSLFAARPAISIPLFAAMAISAAIHLVAVLVPTLQPVFKTFPVSANEWAMVLGLGALVLPAMEVAKIFYRRKLKESGAWPPPGSVVSRKRRRG